jgi:cytochrome d ubiquinol oxidase subunit I
VSVLLAFIAPAFSGLAAQLPAQAPQGHNIVGAQIAIGSLFSLHILIAGLVSGAAELGPAIEFLGYVRQRRSYDRLAHGLGRFITYYFSVSSTIAILLITVLLVGFWGHFWTTIVTIGWWPLFIEAWTFVLQVSLAYLWYYTWEPMRAFKGVHMAIGGLLAIASFLQVYMIDVIASYMLTPTNPQNPVRLALNPTSYPLTVHRTIGNLAYIGFAFGGFCAIRYLRARTAEDKRFYDWAGSFGLLWGVSMTLLQPVVGYSYAKEIQLHSYGSWYKMMFGSLSPVFLWQITLLGIMFLPASNCCRSVWC